jgi:hypothetical protein
MTASVPSKPTPESQAHAPPSERIALRAEIERRFAVELHMVLILLVCFGVGLIVTKILLVSGIGWMWLRYSIALVAAYAAFLGCIRFWLVYAGYALLPDAGAQDSAPHATGGGTSTRRLPDLVRIGAGANAQPAFRGGGGAFAGGGASASFADAAGGAAPLFSDASNPTYSRGAGAGGDGGIDVDGGGVDSGDADGGGWAGGDRGGGGPAVVLIALVAGFLAVFGAAIYLVSMAPTILGDAAFAALLTGGLVRSTRRIRAGGWVGSAIHNTWRPFAFVFALNLVFALTAQFFYPDVRTLADVLAKF